MLAYLLPLPFILAIYSVRQKTLLFMEPGKCLLLSLGSVSFACRCCFKIFIYLFVYLFMAVLGLRCCVQAFSSCGEQGLLFVAVRGLLIAVASLVAEHGL